MNLKPDRTPRGINWAPTYQRKTLLKVCDCPWILCRWNSLVLWCGIGRRVIINFISLRDESGCGMGRRVIINFISLRDESGCGMGRRVIINFISSRVVHESGCGMGRRVIINFISLRDESGCDVEYDNEDFRKSNEGVPEMFVILFGKVIYRRNGKYFSNEQ